MVMNKTMTVTRTLLILATVWALSLALPVSAEFKEVMVPMRDGTELATNISLPDGEGPWPVVLTRTPYGKDRRARRGQPEPNPSEKREQGQQFLDRGYAYVVQDCRGRFKSQGEYRAFIDDMEDGYDTVEWVAGQEWCDGKVGMVGGSATGITTNLAAMARPPHLVCGYATVAHGSSYQNSNHPGGCYLLNLNEEWLKLQGVVLPKVARPISRVYDEGARKRDISHYYSKITIPMVNVGGWYDIFLQGNVDNFVGLHNRGAGNARGNQKLVMGPFGHGPLSGDLEYPDARGRRDGVDQLDFFDCWLKGMDNGIKEAPAVRYYVMGDTLDENAPGNEWRTAENWPPPSTPTPYYLEPGGGLAMTAPQAGGGKSSYIHDPQNPVPSFGGNNLMMDRGPMDQREASARDDVLTFQSEPLEAPVEIAGRIKAKLFVSTQAEDTDFMVKLVDVYPNGYEALVLDHGFRMRFHEGFEKFTRVEKGKVYAIEIDLWSTALIFNKGHRIAIHVSSSNYPRFGIHSNTWDPVMSYDDAVKAENTVYHNADHASHVILPVTKL